MTTQWRSHNNEIDMTGRVELQMLDDRLSPAGTLTDAFSRLRVSSGYTLFDSQNRYEDNGKFVTANTTSTANSAHDFHRNVVTLNVGTAAGDRVTRESKKVFYYQPGKSFLVINTFTFGQPKDGLVQRVGYYNANNGIFLEQSNTDVYLVKRSYTTGSLVEERIPQSEWNVDNFSGSKLSAIETKYDVRSSGNSAIDLTKSHIFWMDVEWLGVGDVRCGFFKDGIPRVAHTFHHYNQIQSPYITTACLPIRYEIENIAETSSPSTLNQICSTVVSEGGFEPNSNNPEYTVGREVNNLYTLSSTANYYNIVTIRLRADAIDSIIIPKGIELVGDSNTNYQWKLYRDATFGIPLVYTNGPNGAVEYSVTNTTVTGGDMLNSGYIQSAGAVSFTGVNLYEQLERLLQPDGTYIPGTYTLAVKPGSSNAKVVGLINYLKVV